MKPLDHFSIPYVGLKDTVHTFYFDIDDAFFQSFENSLVSSGRFKAKLELDKRPDFAVAAIEVKGHALLTCDRCLSEYLHPLNFHFKLHVKYGNTSEDDDEVIYIDEQTSNINFAPYIYDWIIISLPMVKVHEKIIDCDQNVIKKLSEYEVEPIAEDRWSELTKIKFEN